MGAALWAIIGIIGAATVAGLFLIPLPNLYNVEVVVKVTQVSFVVANYFSTSISSAKTLGSSAVLNLPTLGLGPPALYSQFSMTVCVAGSHCSTKIDSSVLPTVPFVNGATLQASDTYDISYVSNGCNVPVSVSLSQSGVGQVASASGTMNVGGGC